MEEQKKRTLITADQEVVVHKWTTEKGERLMTLGDGARWSPMCVCVCGERAVAGDPF